MKRSFTSDPPSHFQSSSREHPPSYPTTNPYNSSQFSNFNQRPQFQMIPADYYGFQQGVDEERLDEEEGREEGEEGGNDYNKVLNASTGFYYDELLKNQEEKQRKFRLGINELFQIAYNNADFPKLYSVFLQYCDPAVTFAAPNLAIKATGLFPLLAYFMVVNEIYPDSMVNNIEKRFATLKIAKPPLGTIYATPTPPLSSSSSSSSPLSLPVPASATPESLLTIHTETLEIIDKFVGTRVLEKGVVEIYSPLLASGQLHQHKHYSLQELTQIISSHLYNLPKSSSSSSTSAANPAAASPIGKIFTFLVETKLTFDLRTNKIIHWNYEILAAHVA